MASTRKHVNLPGHPLAPASGLVLVSRVNLYAKLGAGLHPCHWCGMTLRWHKQQKGRGPKGRDSIYADHLDGDEGNDAADNLVPSCNGCNISRGHRPMEPGAFFVVIAGVRNRAVEHKCLECGHSFLIAISQLTTRKGRFCSRACRNRGVAKESGAAIAEGELFLEIREKHRVKRVRAVKKNCGQCQVEFLAELRFAEKRECCSVSCASKLTAARRKTAKG